MPLLLLLRPGFLHALYCFARLQGLECPTCTGLVQKRRRRNDENNEKQQEHQPEQQRKDRLTDFASPVMLSCQVSRMSSLSYLTGDFTAIIAKLCVSFFFEGGGWVAPFHHHYCASYPSPSSHLFGVVSGRRSPLLDCFSAMQLPFRRRKHTHRTNDIRGRRYTRNISVPASKKSSRVP